MSRHHEPLKPHEGNSPAQEKPAPADSWLLGDLLWGACWGLAFAAPFCAFVAVEAAVNRSMTFEGYNLTLAQIVTGYAASFTTAGIIVGLFRKQARTQGGAIVVGFAAAIPAFFILYISMTGPPQQWRAQDWQNVVVLSATMGPICGALRWNQSRKWAKLRGEKLDSDDGHG